MDASHPLPTEGSPAVLWIVAFMLLILVAAGLVAAYVAYPHRGQQVPRLPWLGRAMRKGVQRLPTLDNTDHADKVDEVGKVGKVGGRRR